jgi:hypothetical protein
MTRTPILSDLCSLPTTAALVPPGRVRTPPPGLVLLAWTLTPGLAMSRSASPALAAPLRRPATTGGFACSHPPV